MYETRSLNPALLSENLKKAVPDAPFIDRLKIAYRPYICPFHTLLQEIPIGSRIFDIGCGAGMFLFLCAQFREPTKLGGLEVKEQLVRQAGQLLHGVGIKPSLSLVKPGELPSNISEFDTLTLIDVFHHVPASAQQEFIQHIFDNMAKGAKLIFKDMNGAFPWAYFNKIHDLLLSGEIGHEILPPHAQRLLSDAGFMISHESKQRMFWYSHYTIIAQKP